MLDIEIDRRSPTPPFRQLSARLESLVEQGSLPAGRRLPPVRRLAEHLGVAPGTVARAYRELETSGILDTRGRHGTFVAGEEAEGRRRLTVAAREFARAASETALSPDQAIELLTHIVREESAGT